MIQYEIKTPDGQIHRIEAMNHTNDSLGLTLYMTGSAAVAVFPKFEWMRLTQNVVAEKPSEPEQPTDIGSDPAPVSPSASGE